MDVGQGAQRFDVRSGPFGRRSPAGVEDPAGGEQEHSPHNAVKA
jgi:hypothetical protein